MGTVEQTPAEAATEQGVERKRGPRGMGGYSRGQTGIKDTYPAQGHRKEHRETWGAHRQQGHRAGGDSPAQRNRTTQKTA